MEQIAELQEIKFEDVLKSQERIPRDLRERNEQKRERYKTFVKNVKASFSEPSFINPIIQKYNRSLIELKQKREEIEKRNETRELAKISMNSILASMKRETEGLRNHMWTLDSASSALQTYNGNCIELKKISELREKSLTYQSLAQRIEGITSAQRSILQTIVDRYAVKYSKKKIECKLIYLNEQTINQLADFYSIDIGVRSYLLSMLKHSRNSLARLVNETYINFIEDKARWN